MFNQLTIKAAMKLWGDEALKASEKEMKQLHWQRSFQPVRWIDLTEEQRKTMLESHIFLQKKRTGEVKARMVAGGNRQRGYIDKEDATSPTVTTKSVILSCIIDAREEREVAVIDIPNAFVQTVIEDDEKDKFIVQLRGEVVDILCNLAPEVYRDYMVIDRRGNKQLLVKCLNALCGSMVASLLYYKKFTRSL